MKRAFIFRSLQRGDIFATTNLGIIGRLHRRYFRPTTSRFHYGLLGEPVYAGLKTPHEPQEERDTVFDEPPEDFVIYESIAKGVAVGRLSWYLNDDVEIYRIVTRNPLDYTWDYGYRATLEASALGRAWYDYSLYLKIIWDGLKAMWRHWRQEGQVYVSYRDMPPLDNASLICTEMCERCYRYHFPVTDGRYLATPANFKQSVLDGRVRTIAKWQPGELE